MIPYRATKATKDLVAVITAECPTQSLQPGRRCPTCGKVVVTTQNLIPPGPELAVCEPCKNRWSDGVCVKWRGWWVV